METHYVHPLRTPITYTHSEHQYVKHVATKLSAAGWSKKQLTRMLKCGETTVETLLHNRFPSRRRWRATLNDLLRIEFLPELREVELHYISQLLSLGFTFEDIELATDTPHLITVGRDRRETPDYRALTNLIILAGGKAEPISETPNCVVENCRARGAWLNIAQGTFCPTHATRARTILSRTRYEVAA